MADISKLEQQANLLFNNVAGWEQSTLQRIGKRIGKYGKMSLADVVEITKVVEMICKIKTNIIKNVSTMIENDFSEIVKDALGERRTDTEGTDAKKSN